MTLYPLDASLTLAEAAPKWLAGHQQYIRPNTLKGYRNGKNIDTITLFAHATRPNMQLRAKVSINLASGACGWDATVACNARRKGHETPTPW